MAVNLLNINVYNDKQLHWKLSVPLELSAKHSRGVCVPWSEPSTGRIYEAIACARASLARTGGERGALFIQEAQRSKLFY